jgi:phage tail sheath gpL-like
MSLQSNSLAAATGATAKNVVFGTETLNLQRKILLIGTFDPLKTAVVPEVAVQVLSPADAADKFGFGSMLHRMVLAADKGGQGVPIYCMPQDEAGAAVAATGTITFVVGTLEAGTYYLYIAGEAVPFNVAAGDTATAVGDACVAAIAAKPELPVSGSNAAGVVTITAKMKGPYGNDISIAFNLGSGEAFPTGATSAAIVDMASGAGIPDIDDALNATGTGDDANEAFYTDVATGYGEDDSTLDKIEAYVGSGNAFTGLYAKTVGRPFRVLRGDVVAGSAGLTAMIAITDLRKNDRANGVISVPDSPNHPVDIACQAIGHMARINNDRAAQNYVGTVLSGVIPGAAANRWTSAYDNRDTAVKSGISPTRVVAGAVQMENVITHYRPDSVPVTSNGYRSMRNISIVQNIINALRVEFSREGWQGISIVEDTGKVVNATDRQKARDVIAVKSALAKLATEMAGRAWLYNSSYTISKLAEAGAVTVRAGNTGFDSILSVILSGEGGILDTTAEFDTSIAVLL